MHVHRIVLRIPLLALAAVAAIVLGGCGQAGPLYLPDQDNSHKNKTLHREQRNNGGQPVNRTPNVDDDAAPPSGSTGSGAATPSTSNAAPVVPQSSVPAAPPSPTTTAPASATPAGVAPAPNASTPSTSSDQPGATP